MRIRSSTAGHANVDHGDSLCLRTACCRKRGCRPKKAHHRKSCHLKKASCQKKTQHQNNKNQCRKMAHHQKAQPEKDFYLSLRREQCSEQTCRMRKKYSRKSRMKQSLRDNSTRPEECKTQEDGTEQKGSLSGHGSLFHEGMMHQEGTGQEESIPPESRMLCKGSPMSCSILLVAGWFFQFHLFKHSFLVLFEACLLPRSFLTLLILTGDYTMATIGKEPSCQGKERKEKWIWTLYSTPDAKAAGTFQLLKHYAILFDPFCSRRSPIGNLYPPARCILGSSWQSYVRRIAQIETDRSIIRLSVSPCFNRFMHGSIVVNSFDHRTMVSGLCTSILLHLINCSRTCMTQS